MSNGSLIFKKVVHSRTERPDEGLYQCSAFKEGVGTIISKEAKLQIASLPPFAKVITDLSVSQEQTVYFPCSIQAVPPASITWFKNQQPLHLDATRMTILPSGALEIDDVQPVDRGTYHCVAENVEKARESDHGTLSVNPKTDELLSSPNFIATPPSTVVIAKGSNLTLDCAANGNPNPIITWLKGNSAIDFSFLGSRFRIVGSGSLNLENVAEEDAGTYMCRAENAEDSIDASSTITVIVPPYFLTKPQNQAVYEKEDVTFKCSVYGRPLPIVRWFKDGDLIVPSEYFQIVNGYNLRILGAVKSDSGIYQCFATNSAGNIQSSAQLKVLSNDSSESAAFSLPVTLPNFPHKPGFLQFHKEGPSAPLNLTAVIVKTRFITLSWEQPVQRNGPIIAYSVYYREINSSRERVQNITRPVVEDINIQGLQPATNYVFRVIAYNQHGPGRSSNELLVQTLNDVYVPNSPNSLTVIPRNSTSILVKWNPPDTKKESAEYYKLFYVASGSSDEQEIETNSTSYELNDLKKFTEYTFWVTAFNKNGPGMSTDEVTVRTHDDKPGDTPQNVSLEPASSTSITIRWEPPPLEYQNGVITGYKIRFKKRSGNAETKTADGSRRLYALVDLEKGAEYMVKIAAITAKGTGPFTDWQTVETYSNDLIESKVPEMPSSLRARPSANSIFVSWVPPRDQTIIVRGYKLGWGIGLADVYTKILDGKQRHFTIEKLQSSSEYVISLLAFNEAGDGRPVYETVKTQVETTPEPLTPMLPPVGLKAIVLSSSTVVLYWTDTTLSRNQVVTDNRFYTVRYTAYIYSSAPKYRFFNSSDLNCMIDDLKPNAQYEFSVKVVKGKRESTWSMSILNTTEEAAPSSPPRDLTVVPSEDDNSVINLHWQPPKQPNGHITGYVIFYTTDKTQRDRDWVVEGVVGDKMTTILKGLTLDTMYYFKIQARNNKGYGPLSSEIAFHTAAGLALASGSSYFESKGFANSLLYIIISCISGITMIIIIGVSIAVCRRRNRYLAPDGCKSYKSSKGASSKNKGAAKDLVPPDLWIHHDQMELKSMDKSSNSNMYSSSSQRSSQELGHEPLLNTLEKKKSAYLDSLNDDLLPNSDKCYVKCRPIRAAPLKISLDHQKPVISIDASVITSSGGMHPSAYDVGTTNSLGRPMYPRTQYNIQRNLGPHDIQPAVVLGEPPPPPVSLPLCPPPSCTATIRSVSETHGRLNSENQTVAFIPTVHETPEVGNCSTLTKKQSSQQHPMRSFTIPASSSQSVPATPLSKHTAIKSPPVVLSPHKKVVLHIPGETSSSLVQSSSKPPSTAVVSPTTSDSNSPPIQPSESTEHLNQEVANLEGLMKDLNAITASEFEC
ncbi:neogenin isoform X2 [Parasteatoda tepidariorum]|nr:neogenin isoform X2 [Parasteatoda tepidariorum]